MNTANIILLLVAHFYSKNGVTSAKNLGTGGHLHHLGVVLCNKSASPSAAPDSAAAAAAAVKENTHIRSSLYLRVLALCQHHTMTECGMLQYYDSQQGAKLYKQSNVPLLAGIGCLSCVF